MVKASVERNHTCNLYLLSNTCFSWKRRLDQFGNNSGGAANTLSMSGYHAYSVDLDIGVEDPLWIPKPFNHVPVKGPL